MIFEYYENIDRVLPAIDEGEPGPSEVDSREATRLEDALRAHNPRVELVKIETGSIRVLWLGVRNVPLEER